MEPRSVDTYRVAEGGVIALMDGHIHVRIYKDPPAFPVLQWWLDETAASRHLCRSRWVKRTVFRWRKDERKEERNEVG